MIENEQPINFPPPFLHKLYDYTGCSNGSQKGFFLVYIDHKGEPFAIKKAENVATSMALQEALKMISQNQEDIFELE